MYAQQQRDYTGKMGFNEFKELWDTLNKWKENFMTYDRDGSGNIDPYEFQRAIESWGYKLSPSLLNILVKRYSTNLRIPFDEFIACAIRLRSLTDQFKGLADQTGKASFEYELFLQVSMCN